jgi:hypothetical protein
MNWSAPVASNPPNLLEYYNAANAVYADNAIGTQSGTAPPASTGLTLVLDSRDSSLTGNSSWLSDGFFAQAFKDASGNIIIAFEGSIIDPLDPSFNTPYGNGSRGADFDISIGLVPKAFLDADTFALDVKQYIAQHTLGSNPIYLTGHSLGGAEAQDVAFVIDPGESGVTFGAPGDPRLTAPVNAPNFINYVDYGDPVGHIGNHFGTVQPVGSPLNAEVGSLAAAALFHPLSQYAADLGLSSTVTPGTVEAANLGILRVADTVTDAYAVAAIINSGQLTFANYVNQLIGQAQSTTVPAVAVEATMYGMTGTSAEITFLTTNFLPAQVANATHWGLNAQVYACEVLGLAFAFGNETGNTAYSSNFGPSNSAMPNTTAGDAAFASAASHAIFDTASTANLVNVMQNFVSNWETFYTAHGVPGLSNPSAAQIDLAARGAAWGDMVGVALANNLGPVNGQTINFLDDAAQGTAIYGASLIGQPIHQPFA